MKTDGSIFGTPLWLLGLAALAAILHSGAARRVEKYNGLGRKRAALRRTEREHIDSHLPRALGR